MTARRPRLAAGLVGAVLACTALAAPAAAATPSTAERAGHSAARPAGAVVVRAHEGALDAARAAVAAAGGRITRDLDIIFGFAAELPADRVAALRAHPAVQSVTEDGSVRFAALDPALGYDATGDVGSLHSLTKIVGAQEAWRAGFTGKGVDIAMIDTGVAPVSGLTSGNVVHGPDLSFDSQDPALTRVDGFGHGTHMASVMVGRDAAGTPAEYSSPKRFTGVAPDARLVSVKVGARDGAVDVSQVIAAIDWVSQHARTNGLNVRVLNLSFGTDSAQDPRLDPLSYAAEVAMRRGVLVVVSSGNDGRTDRRALANPAHNAHVLTVGAESPEGTLDVADDIVPSWVNSGTSARHVDLVAPGASVLGLRAPGSWLDTQHSTARVGERFFRGSGTSQAAAVVSGAAALLFQRYPLMSTYTAKAHLMQNATLLPSEGGYRQGRGVVDVAKALKAGRIAVTPKTPVQGIGTGSLEQARGTFHVGDTLGDGTLVELTGETDIMSRSWDSAALSRAAAGGSAWTGGAFNGSTWTGSSFEGTAWSGSAWTGRSWSGRSWSGRSWSGRSWSGRSWSAGSWAGAQWS